MKKLLSWLDDHLLKLGVGFLLFFIPLWPKLPLINVIRTWVYIRAEDFLIAFLFVFWFIQFIRHKVNLKTPLTIPIIFFWLIGGISSIFSILFLARLIPNFFPHLVILNFLRRIEYMGLFFIAFSTVKSKKDLYHYLIILMVTISAVIFYGFGQKIFGFPAFLTMNEEFAKGVPLYLGPGARLTSTFAGHYDLAAYLVFVIPILGSLIFGVRKIIFKLGLVFLAIFSLLLLLFTASRVSFIVYLVSVILMLWWQKRKILIIPVIIFSFLIMSVASGTGERFFKTLRVKQVVYDVNTGRAVATIDKQNGQNIIAETQASPAEDTLPTGTGFISLPVVAPVAPKTITITQLTKQSLATGSGEVATVSGNFLIQKVLVYDISFTTRFQGEWPRAIEALKRNLLLGSGYSSISLATDNDYLRILGETGILGMLSFIFLAATIGVFIKSALSKIEDSMVRGLAIGLGAGLMALAINAILIDVFEASKVAYTLWLVLGIAFGGIGLFYKEKIPVLEPLKKIFFHPLFPVICLFALTFILLAKSMNNYFVGDDFTWLRWAAQGTFKDIPFYFTQASGFFYRPLPKILYLGSFTVFWLLPGGYHFLALLCHFGVVSLTFLLTLKISKNKLLAILASLIFLVFSVHGESIFWISTLGNSLFTLLFMASFFFYVIFRSGKGKIFFPAALILMILSLLSYEGAVIGPLIILLYELVLQKKKIGYTLPFLILIPVYLFLRNSAGALPLSGDYNYNLRLLPANFIGNLLGYSGLVLAGPNFLSYYDRLRELAKSSKEIMLGFSFGLIIIGLILGIILKKRIHLSKLTIFNLGFFILGLLPFFGLGNISERYVYLSSVGAAILLAQLVYFIFSQIKRKQFLLGWMVLILFSGIILNYYFSDLMRSEKDWYQAGEISRKALLDLRNTYFTKTLNNTFYFVNQPIKFGRAWVFPVGLDDAIWHTFRDDSLKVVKVKSEEEALNLKDKTPNSHVFVFENGEIKEIIREVKEVPIP